jgi:hypothetical protein
MDHIR